jgi:hypothetical protein
MPCGTQRRVRRHAAACCHCRPVQLSRGWPSASRAPCVAWTPKGMPMSLHLPILVVYARLLIAWRHHQPWQSHCISCYQLCCIAKPLSR